MKQKKSNQFSWLSTYATNIDAKLQTLLPKKTAFPKRLNDAMHYALLGGGKRLRPILTVLSCQMLGGKKQHALIAGSAIEMIHTYSLVHDDLPAMDDDDLRRGRPTVHKKYDEALAILVGDGLLTLAFEILSTKIKDPSMSAKLIACLAKAAGYNGMVGGQVLDMASSKRVSLKTIEQIHLNKTAAMISASLEMGAIAANADRATCKKLATAGTHFGLAFQIADDLLDIQSTSKVLGKTVGKDQVQEKGTYPAKLGVEKSKRAAEKYIAKACSILDSYGSKSKRLQDLGRYIVERKK